MKRKIFFCLLAPILVSPCAPGSGADGAITNNLIDYSQFRRIVVESQSEREGRRLTEGQFLSMMNRPGTLLLDARSAATYELRHIKGATNLPLTEFTADSLAKIAPDKNVTVLIYCNNNFAGTPGSLPTKAPAAALNLSTYTTLKAYGYTNVFELGPVLDVSQTRLPFQGKEAAAEFPASGKGR